MKIRDSQRDFETHERLKAELNIRGASLASIGRELGVSSTSMSLVGLGKHRSARIEQAIARALGKKPKEIWPWRFQKEREE